MSNEDDFDPAIFGGLLDDPEIEPGTAMAAAMPDREPKPPGEPKQLSGWFVAGVVLGVILFLLLLL